jgi:hypothetical protein
MIRDYATWLAAVGLIWLACASVLGAKGRPEGHLPSQSAAIHADNSMLHPQLSKNPTWAGALVIVILGLFVAAAAVGVVVRANMPDEPLPSDDQEHDAHAHHS